ncbi:hypothetical protein ACJX0J_030389, partial [Zea mays]
MIEYKHSLHLFNVNIIINKVNVAMSIGHLRVAVDDFQPVTTAHNYSWSKINLIVKLKMNNINIFLPRRLRLALHKYSVIEVISWLIPHYGHIAAVSDLSGNSKIYSEATCQVAIW